MKTAFLQNYFIYSLSFFASVTVAIIIVGRKRSFDILGLFLPFLGILVVTYWLKPGADFLLGNMKPAWLPMGTADHFDRELAAISLAASLSIIAFALGYRARIGDHFISELSRHSPLARSSLGSTIPKPVLILIISMIVLGYWSLLKYSVFPGIRDYYTVSMMSTAEGSIFVGTTGYFVKAHGMIATGCILYYAWTKRLWVLFLASTPWVVGRLYSGWSRGALLVLLISCCAIFLCQKRKEKGYQFLINRYSFQLGITVVLVLAFLSLFPVIRYDRTFFQKGGVSADKLAAGYKTAYERTDSGVVTDDLAGFDDTLYFLERVPKEIGYQYGTGYLFQYLVMPFPRMLWPGKPLSVADWSFVKWLNINFAPRDLTRYAAAPGAIGEAYLQYGFIGIIIIFWLTGVCLSWAQRLFIGLSGSPAVESGYAILYGSMCLLGRDSFFSFLPFYMLFTGIPLGLAYLIERRMSPDKSMKQHGLRLTYNNRKIF